MRIHGKEDDRINLHRPGTGSVSQSGENDGIPPRWPDGTKHVRDVYAPTEAECEANLAALIAEMNAERAVWREENKTSYAEHEARRHGLRAFVMDTDIKNSLSTNPGRLFA